MNIVKLQRQLQSVPEQALVGYVQNPDGRVPSYLALTELSRRKQMREEYQKAAAPEKSVAESMVEEASGIAAIPQQMGQPMPQQMAPQMPPQMGQAPQPQAPMQMAEGGLAALSLPDDMFDEESYAGGGIVAFDEGGEVERFQKGGLSQDDIAYHRALENVYNPFELGRRAINYGADILSAPGQMSWMRDPKTGKLVRAYEVEGFMPRTTGFNAAEARNKQSRLAQLDLAEADNITRANLAGKPVTVGATREGINQLVADATAPQGAFMDRMVDIPTADKDMKSLGDTRTRKEKAVVDTAAGTGKGGPTRNARGDLVFDTITVDDAGYNKLMPKEQAMRDYAAEFKSELGEDAGRIAMKDRLAKMQAMGEKEAERAPWMALAEAGLGMAAGKSQFALQNIAEGGIRGIKSFAEARDNLRKAEERRFDLESKVAQAERAEQLAAINYGAESKRTDDANRRAVGLAKQADTARAAEVTARGKYDAIKDNYVLDQKDREMKMTHDYQMGHLALQREANTLSKSTQLAEKQRAMYEKALDNARTDVMNSAKLTGTEGSMTQQQYDSAVYARYLENLSALGLKPLGSASGFKVLGVEGQKGKN